MKEKTISVIIPLRNEALYLVKLLDMLHRQPIDQIILVDGGSRDRSPALLQTWARNSNACKHRIAMDAPPGRATQMNAGAKEATGDILLFLHADTQLPPDGIARVLQTMKNKNIFGGAFRLQIDSKHPFMLWVCWLANLRSFYWGLPYGDQAIFVRRAIFEKLGGYPALPLMEDVAFVRKLKKTGRMLLLKEAVTTSARRWQQQGYFLNSFKNMLILLFYFCGVSPQGLAAWYYPKKSVQQSKK
ncbi:Glycosyl transferase, family 2 [hydrothermal vent metagenome]|uniref:Glycosyl transferase, family 2 n=1 Tax=hydrothermal vent metagenome TaxID=652676 RepID=A0A3B1D4U8_9ZZZZ|nr:glycosyltransferase family 2 protein [Candidatus Manganitrophaceae bacterium]